MKLKRSLLCFCVGVASLFFASSEIAAAAVNSPTGTVKPEPAQVSKNDFMREKPFTNGKVIVALKTGQQVEIQKREGSWYFIKNGTKTGWAPMLSIRRTQQPSSGTASGSLSSKSTGRSSTGGVVSTTGIRGLNEEELQTAAFDESSVAVAERYRVTAAEADTFAGDAGLKPRKVMSLSAPSTGGRR